MPDLSSFHDELFPVSISFGATGGPERRNEIVQLTSGREKRNARFAHSRRRYDVGTGVRSLDDLYAVQSFFEARRGSLHAFRFRDPFDMKSCAPADVPTATDQAIGTGDGARTRFALVKNYGTGDDTYRRPIRLPQAGSLTVAVDGTIQAGTAFWFDASAGEVVFMTAPAAGEEVTAGYAFDVSARFDTDAIQASMTVFKAGQIPSIPLVEVAL